MKKIILMVVTVMLIATGQVWGENTGTVKNEKIITQKRDINNEVNISTYMVIGDGVEMVHLSFH